MSWTLFCCADMCVCWACEFSAPKIFYKTYFYSVLPKVASTVLIKRPILPFLTSYSISINDDGIHGVSDLSRCIAVIVLCFLLSVVPLVVLLWIRITLPAFTRAAVTYFSFACIFGGYTFAFTRLILFCPWWLMNLYCFGMLVCMMIQHHSGLYLNIYTYIRVRVPSLS